MSSPASATQTATSKTIYSYKFTLNSVQISSDSGQTFTDIFSGSSECSSGASTEAAYQKKSTVCDDVTIPDGTYNYLKITRSQVGYIRLEAVFPNGNTYYMKQNGTFSTTAPAEEGDFAVLASLYDGAIDNTIFDAGYKRTIKISADLSSFLVQADDSYTVFIVTIVESIEIGDPAAQSALGTNQKYTITRTLTFPIGK